MNEQLISFETAKLAKEKGFKLGSGWQIRSLFNIKDGTTFCEKTIETPEYACERCTQSLLQKWLRDKYCIHVEIIWVDTLSDIYVYHISTTNNATRPDSIFYHSYEEALEFGLQEALKLI